MELTKEEKRLLCDLIYLGNWIINSHRKPSQLIEKYDRLCEKLLGTNCYLDRLQKYIDGYDEEGYPYIVARKLAKLHYPVDRNSNEYCASIHLQLDVAEIYETEIREKGIGILSIFVSDFNKKLMSKGKHKD